MRQQAIAILTPRDLRLRRSVTKHRLRAGRLLKRLAMAEPSSRKLVGIAAILLLIVLWAAFVAALAPSVGRWPVLVQAPYYLVMGLVWIVPLKPLRAQGLRQIGRAHV